MKKLKKLNHTSFFYFARNIQIMLLKGKKAIVTGGTRGIGYAVVKKFAEQGADVAFTYLSSAEKASQMEVELSAQFGVKVKAYHSNAAVFAEAEKLVEEVLNEFGAIDVLVNNAGITKDNLILRMTEEQFDEVLQSNLKSVFNTTKNVSKSMLRQKSGTIINIASIVGMRGQAGQSNYAASKAGIIGFTKSIADEFGSRNIRCNAISPGFIETDMTAVLPEEMKKNLLDQIPLQRMGQAEDVANAALYLASDLSTYVTAQVISVCGGMCR